MTSGNGKGNGNSKDKRISDVSLVTGFPAFTARRLIRRLLEKDAKEVVHLLHQNKVYREAQQFLADLPAPQRRRMRLLEGDVCDMDLGLRGPEYKALVADVTAIHHTAAVYHLGAERAHAEQVNVEGTRSILEVAGDCPKLRRLTHWSTAQVSGTRSGVILEEELDCGQRFRNFYEETKFKAELLVRHAMSRLPITVLRPGIIVGDSKSGEIDRFDGPYYLLVLIVSAPIDLRLPLPGRGTAPLNLVPVDFVVDAAVALSKHENARSGTFHLTDPCPLSARTVYELVARRADRKIPRGSIPTGLARALMRAPGLERLVRAPRVFLESFNHLALFNCRRTLALLEGSGVRCPAFDDYVDALVRYVQKVQAQQKERKQEEQEIADPFDP